MSEHSKEPWRAGGESGSFIVCNPPGANTLPGADDPFYGGDLVAESLCQPDARRAVAAVNAVEGIPTDELEMIVRAGKRLTAHGEPRPTDAEEKGWTDFLLGHWTKRSPTSPGFYLIDGTIDPLICTSGGAHQRCAVEVTEDDIKDMSCGMSMLGVEWWWSRPLAAACITPPSPLAVPREGDGSAREPMPEAMRATGVPDGQSK
jgi:hypothetical protein